jgi:hypothetical protein
VDDAAPGEGLRIVGQYVQRAAVGGQGLLVPALKAVNFSAVSEGLGVMLKEIPEIEWHVCAVHGGHPESIWDGEEPVDLIKKVAWWRCTNTGHPLAPVGQLTGETARTL